MSQPIQNQQVNRPSTTPKSNPPQPKTNKPARPGEPDAFARLAEAAASAQAYLNNPKAEKTSTRREPVRLVPAPAEKTSVSSGLLCGSGLQPRQDSASREDFLLRASPAQGSGSRSKDSDCPAGSSAKKKSAARPSPARGHLRSRALSGTSTVRQAKNYLRVSRSPSFLRSTPNLQRHRRKCAICRHHEREMIEELFVRWHSPQAIANFLRDYEEINWVSIYRHAYALGLDHVRRRNLRHFFENLLDDAINATPTFAGVLGAARALGCVTEDGRWVEPEKRITMTTVIRNEEPSSTTASSTEQEEPDVPLSASFRERTEGRGSSSTSLRASFQNRDFAETSGPVPPVGSGGSGSPARDSSARWGGGPDLPACAVRAGRREIRLPLNSHKTKAKTISNR